MPQVVLAFVAGFVVGLIVAWIYWQQRIEEQRAAIAELEQKTSELKAPPTQKAPQIAVPPRTAEPEEIVVGLDDLKRIEGIGPKIAGLLQEAGIITFAQLAAAEVSRLEQILRDADLPFTDPSTWPGQAGLAAAGDWKTLEVLQDGLKGGRR